MRTIVFANGVISDPHAARALIHPGEIVIAADGGADHCREMGIVPTIIIGDLDSLSTAETAHWEALGVQIIRHNPDKDETDLELALLHAQELGQEEALVLGAFGGRWDQTFANLMLPAYASLEDLHITFWDNGTWVYLVRHQREITGHAGQTISLIPLKGDVVGVSTEGLEWPLRDETLKFGASRGVSNQLKGAQATVRVREGLLLCFVLDVNDVD